MATTYGPGPCRANKNFLGFGDNSLGIISERKIEPDQKFQAFVGDLGIAKIPDHAVKILGIEIDKLFCHGRTP